MFSKKPSPKRSLNQSHPAITPTTPNRPAPVVPLLQKAKSERTLWSPAHILQLHGGLGNQAVAHWMESHPQGAVIQRALMKGSDLLKKTNRKDSELKAIAEILDRYHDTKGVLKKLNPPLISQRLAILRDLDKSIYQWFDTVSQDLPTLSENPHTAVMKQLLKASDEEHITLVDKGKGDILPFDTSGLEAGEVRELQELWKSLVAGTGKIKRIGDAKFNQAMLSDLAKILNTNTGRRLLTYLNTTPEAERTAEEENLLTNIYIGQRAGQLPQAVTAQLPKAIDETEESQSQPLDERKAYMETAVPIAGKKPKGYARVGRMGDVPEAAQEGKRGIVYANQKYAFGEGTGAFVRIVSDGNAGVRAGVPGSDHEIIAPRFITLAHELGHSANQRAGAGVAGGLRVAELLGLGADSTEKNKVRWDDPEEMLNITNVENPIRAESGLEERTSHKSAGGLHKTMRILEIRDRIVGQFGIESHEDSFAYANRKSKGIWLTATGTRFCETLEKVRNSLDNEENWRKLNAQLVEVTGMDEDTEKEEFVLAEYEKVKAKVKARGGSAALKEHQRLAYQTVKDKVTNHLNEHLSSPNSQIKLVDDLWQLDGMLGGRLEVPGNGIKLIAW